MAAIQHKYKKPKSIHYIGEYTDSVDLNPKINWKECIKEHFEKVSYSMVAVAHFPDEAFPFKVYRKDDFNEC